jgi:hypothetical protein
MPELQGAFSDGIKLREVNMKYFLSFILATVVVINVFAQQNTTLESVKIETCGNYKTPIILPQITDLLIEIKPSTNADSKIIVENPCSVEKTKQDKLPETELPKFSPFIKP